MEATVTLLQSLLRLDTNGIYFMQLNCGETEHEPVANQLLGKVLTTCTFLRMLQFVHVCSLFILAGFKLVTS